MLSPLGRISEALADLTKAIQMKPSARLYRHRGTLYFISEVSFQLDSSTEIEQSLRAVIFRTLAVVGSYFGNCNPKKDIF